MPMSKELAIKLEDRPGTLARVCRTLADQGVNILAIQAVPSETSSLVRFVVDNSAAARKVLDNEGLSYTETDVAQAKLQHRPGELARVASRLGEAGINISYIYSGVDPSSGTPLVIVGVREAGQAAAILDQLPAVAA